MNRSPGFSARLPLLSRWYLRRARAPKFCLGGCQFGAVVEAQRRGLAAHCGQPVEFVDLIIAGDRTVNQPTEAFAGVLVEDGHDLDRNQIRTQAGAEARPDCITSAAF